MADDDLDDVIRQADPDRWLSSRFIADAAARADVLTLYAFDQELARAVRVTSNALLAEIRLTWWREVLDEIDSRGSVRFHPVAARLAELVRRRGLPREPLEAMIDGRIEALDAAALSLAQGRRWAESVAGSAAILAGFILDPIAPSGVLKRAGALWGLAVLARSGRLERTDAADHIALALPAVRGAALRLSPAAFPAVVHATFARGLRSVGDESRLQRQARLLLAVITGRI